MNTKNNKEIEVYSATTFSDVIASPTFYAIAIITLVLGFSSIFGFLQSPQKLKVVIDTLAKKVAVTEQYQVKHSLDERYQDEYSLSNSLSTLRASQTENDSESSNTLSFIDTDRYSIFAEDSSVQTNKKEVVSGAMQLASFDYDITSKHFWDDLDLSRIESAKEEIYRRSNDVLMIGVPVDTNVLPRTGDAKYSMKVDRG
jgi:hypothetical protein